MAAKRWSDLDPRVRKAIIGVGAAEGLLKVAALADMRRRPAEQIRGKKRNWALAMIVNSAGLIPLCYFLFGRRRDSLRAALTTSSRIRDHGRDPFCTASGNLSRAVGGPWTPVLACWL